jgi:hypothetical protein
MLAFEWTDSYGTLPDWLAALGTVGAFAVTYALLRKEQQARREDQDDRRRAQARLIAAWTTRSTPLYDPSSGRGRLEFRIRNGSEEPVYDVLMMMVPRQSAFADDPVEANFHTEESAVLVELPILPPNHVEERDLRVEGGLARGRLGLAFTDTADRRWKRYPDGRLQLVSAPQPARQRSVKDRLDAFAKGQMDELDT